MPQAPAAAAIKPFLEDIGQAPREELLAEAEEMRNYPAGKLMLAELEPGDEMLVLLEGRAAVTVGASEIHDEERIGEIAAGQCAGEVALLTGSLRSASVRAIDPVTALVFRREQLLSLMRRYPSVADHFLSLLAERLASADQVLASALNPTAHGAQPLEGLDRQTREIAVRRQPATRLLRRAFPRAPRRAPPGAALLFDDQLPRLLHRRARRPVGGERAGLPAGAALASGLRERRVPAPGQRRVEPLRLPETDPGRAVRGLRRGGGLIINELSVWLSFDIFYSDIFTRDPTLVFDPAVLYHRSTTLWVFTIVAVVLIQATYLSRFYRRAFYLLRDRWAARK